MVFKMASFGDFQKENAPFGWFRNAKNPNPPHIQGKNMNKNLTKHGQNLLENKKTRENSQFSVIFLFIFWPCICQKNLRAHKNKIGTPPQPPPKRGILWTWVFLQKERIFLGAHKIGAAIFGPELRTKNFTDTRICLYMG